MENRSICAIDNVIAMLAGRWKFQIIHWLLEGPKRFNELQRLLGGITHRTLSLQLRDLASDGLVLRHDHGTIPPRVDYALTEKGKTLKPVLVAMHKWGAAHAAQREDEIT